MFAALASQAQSIESRQALLIINMQNDIFIGDSVLQPKPADQTERISKLARSFRKLGDIVWVRTEISETSKISGEVSPVDPKTRPRFESYHASSRSKAKKKKGAAPPKGESSPPLNDNDRQLIEAQIHDKIGQPYQIYKPGSHGAQIKDDLLPLVDKDHDLIIVKNHYSAFDETPLLMSLRMKFITRLYLCGNISNVSIFYTATDAARHGFDVTVVEDCLAYVSREKHIESMQKMADSLGVNGIDSSELIAEAAAQVPASGGDESTHPISSFNEVKQSDVQALEQILAATKLDSRDKKKQKQKMAQPPADAPGDAPAPTTSRRRRTKLPEVCGPGDPIGEGDSKILFDALPADFAAEAFQLVRQEVDWRIMMHRTGEVPRRVAVQGDISEKGSFPIYRHPADESPPLLSFSKAVSRIRDEVQKLLGQPFNHVLIQLYRHGNDYISEHSDKTLDIVRGSSIINVSLGAQRNMTLRTKKSATPADKDGNPGERPTQKIPMPHNSVFVLGQHTNESWLHGIRQDKRLDFERLPAEKAFGGERISLTFRHIGTFHTSDNKIWGQGAKNKDEANAAPISSTDSTDMEAMVIAFGRENQQSDFDWDREYGPGFNVMNLVTINAPLASETKSTLYLSNDDKIANLRTKMAVIASGIECVFSHDKPPSPHSQPASPASSRPMSPSLGPGPAPALKAADYFAGPVFKPADAAQSPVSGDLAILLFLRNLRGSFSSSVPSKKDPAVPSPPSQNVASTTNSLDRRVFSRVSRANELFYLWQKMQGVPLTASTKSTHPIRAPGTASGARTPVERPAAAGAAAPAAAAAPAHLTDESAGESPTDVFEGEMEVWEAYFIDDACAVGSGADAGGDGAKDTSGASSEGQEDFGIVDCAFWPVLDEVAREWKGWSGDKFPALDKYWKRVAELGVVKAAHEDLAGM